MSFTSGFTQAINIKLIGSSNLKSSMGNAAGEVQKLKSALTDLRSAGLKLMGVGVGISTAFIGPVVQASKFNTQLVRTGKLAGIGADEMKVLGDVALELGAKTLFTAQQVALGQEELVRLGFGMEVVGNKAGAFGEVLNFASAHQIEMNDSAQMLIGTLRSFNRPLSEAGDVSNMFSTVLSRTGFSMDGLTEALKMANTSIPAFNQSIETQLTLLGILANRQQGTSIGARRLSTAMTQIYTQQDKINKLFGKNTFKVYDELSGKQKNFIDVVFDMRGAMQGFSEERKAVVLKDLVGTIGLKALVPLLKAPVEEFKNLSQAISEGAISTSGFAEAVRKTPKGMWLLMKSAISGVTMEIGQHLMPIATATMRVVTNLSDRFLGFLKAHPILSRIVLISTALLGVVTLLGGGFLVATSMLGLMMTSSAALGTSLISLAAGLAGTSVSSLTLSGALGVLSATIWSILWPVAAVALGVVLLYKAWQHNFLGLKDTVDATWILIKPFFLWIKSVFQITAGFIKTSVGKIIQSIRGWYTSWNAAFTGMKSPLMAFAGMVAYVVGFIVGILSKVYSIVSPALLSVFTYLKMGFKGAFQVISGVFTAFLSVFTGIFEIVVSILQGDFTGALSAVKTMVRGVVGGMITAFKGFWIFLKGLFGVLISGFKVAFLTILTTIKVTISGIWSVIKNLFSFIWDGLGWITQKFGNFGAKIYTTLSGSFGRIRDLLTSVFAGLGETLNSVFSTVEAIITGLWSRIKSTFLDGFNWLFSKINGAIRGVNKISGVIGIPAIPEMPAFSKGVADVPRDMLAVIHQGEAVIPKADNPFRSSSIIKNTFNNSKRNQSTRIDRSVHVAGITIQVSNGDALDFKTKLLEVFEELAGKSETLEGAI
jgi:TP901 family phage tail tape measure protein